MDNTERYISLIEEEIAASVPALTGELSEVPEMLRTPIVRNGKKATVGYCPEVWKDWE